MGNSSGKSEVPTTAPLVPDGKSGKKGKRNAEDAIEKAASAKKQKPVPDEKIPPMKVESSSPDESSESEDEVMVQPKKAARSAKQESSSYSSGERSSGERLAKKTDMPTKAPAVAKKMEESSPSSDSESSDSEKPATEVKNSAVATVQTKNQEQNNSERDSDDSSDEPANSTILAKRPIASDLWSRIVFVGNLSDSVELEQVRRFLEGAGQITDIRFATFHEKIYKGLVQAEFVTVEGAKMAFRELSGRSLAGQAVRLYHAHERGTEREVRYCGPDPGEVRRYLQKHITTTFCLDIPNYMQLQGMGVGERLETPAFTLGGFSWEIHFYPDGADEQYADCASAVLCCTSANIPKAELSLRVLNQGGEVVYDGLARNISQDQVQRELGCLDFMEQYRLMELGPFRMQFIITVISESPLEPRELDGLKTDLEHMLNSGLGADVIFDIRGREIPAHRFVLRARSPVFFAHFGGWLPAEEEEDVAVAKDVTRIVIDDVHPDIFELMLHFIYTDEMRWPNNDNGECYSSEVFEHLAVAADYYGLQKLKMLCEKELGDRLEEQTVMGRFIFAEQYNFRDLMHRCLQAMSSKPELAKASYILGWREYVICMSLISCEHNVPERPDGEGRLEEKDRREEVDSGGSG